MKLLTRSVTGVSDVPHTNEIFLDVCLANEIFLGLEGRRDLEVKLYERLSPEEVSHGVTVKNNIRKMPNKTKKEKVI